MPRPRVYEPDRVLDAVESLAVASGPAAVTIRAISAAIGVSNGALYHTFGSRSGLMGRAWPDADSSPGRTHWSIGLCRKPAHGLPLRPRRPPLTLRWSSPSSIRTPPNYC